MSGVCIVRAADAVRHGRENLGAPVPEEPTPQSPEQAGADIGRRLALDRALALVARAALSRGYTALAVKAGAAALRFAPGSLAANLAMGLAFRRGAQNRRALPYLRRAADSDDARRRGHWELAKVLLHLERSASSPETLRTYRAARLSELRAAAASSDPGIRRRAAIALADSLHDHGRSSEALAVIEPVLNESPHDVRALRTAIYTLVAQNRIAEACALYRRGRAMDPDDLRTKPLKGLEPLCESTDAPQPSPGTRSASWLIAIGGGIGDILHCTPTIANIARRTGEAVDVLVLGDHGGVEFLVRNPACVNRAWTLCPEVLQQPYRNVFVTHSFGPLRFSFHADRIENTRDWQHFRAGRLNETLFNLEAAKEIFGIPYGDQDTGRYFVGDLERLPAREPLVGVHAGSKGGRWLSKRWPYFAELATRLSARGIPVASFGTADEYVSGTQDRTGGSIESMCRTMRDCSLFVSNDSGPMHIAGALGIPVLSIFAPTDALSHLPLAAGAVALALRKHCSPCEVKNHALFASGQCRCVGDIPVEAVERELLALLSANRATCEVAA